MNKRITFIFLTVIMLLVIATNIVSATGSLGVVNIENGNTTTNTTNTINNTTNNTMQNKVNNTVTNKTTNALTNNTTKLPQTGIEENTALIVAFIGISVVSAVYAYTKIKKYNKI